MGLLSAWLAAQDLGRLAQLLAAQVLTGAPQGSDFLKLYAGVWLLVHEPASVYDLSAQLAVQQRIGWPGPLVPFLLPPYAAVLVGWLGALPYSAAYVVWLGLNVACLVVATRLLAPRPWLLWLPLGLLFLPSFLGLAQGQTAALVLASGLVVLALVAFGVIWRRGLAKDDVAWSQLAALPVAATLCAPYALAHELTVWLGSLWLLWRYTRTRPWGRAGLLWLAAAVWLVGDLAVALPTAGGADVAALLGLVLLGTLAGHLARR